MHIQPRAERSFKVLVRRLPRYDLGVRPRKIGGNPHLARIGDEDVTEIWELKFLHSAFPVKHTREETYYRTWHGRSGNNRSRGRPSPTGGRLPYGELPRCEYG